MEATGQALVVRLEAMDRVARSEAMEVDQLVPVEDMEEDLAAQAQDTEAHLSEQSEVMIQQDLLETMDQAEAMEEVLVELVQVMADSQVVVTEDLQEQVVTEQDLLD